MNKFFTVAGIILFAAAGYCQLPQVLTIPATSNGYFVTQDSLRDNTRYILTVTGKISYWRDSVPPDENDADAGFVYHIPYQSGINNATIDSINASLSVPQYLPCNGSECISVPPSFGCPAVPNIHNDNVYRGTLVHVDKDYLDVNDGASDDEFCPRNGSNTNSLYWEGMIGHGKPAAFHINDGDGNYKNNWGALHITITRLEPILYVDTPIINFGKVRCNSGQRMKTDTIKNVGSPIFPGCDRTILGLTLKRASITGDTGANGFTIVGVDAEDSIPQGDAVGFQVYFSPKQMKVYTAVIHFLTNDPQVPQLDVTITGQGIQGLLGENPADTLDFGDTPVNVTKKRAVAIVNNGTDVLVFKGITRNNQDSAFGLPPQQQSNINIPIKGGVTDTFSFSPTKLITYFDSVTISSDSYTGSQKMFYLKGRGVAVILEVDSVLDFGDALISDTINRNLPLINVGNLPFGVQLVRFVSGDSSEFTAEPRTHISIGSGDTLNWQMGFHPRQIGRRSAVAMIVADGGGQARFVNLVGYGTAPSSLAVTSSLDYGIVALGADSIQNVVLRNTGKLPIIIQNATLDDPTVWSIGSVPFTRIVPGDSLAMAIAFSPTAQQNYQTELHITDDSGRQYITLLTGIGKRYIGILSVPDTLDFGQMYVGDTTFRSLPISNAGIAPLALDKMLFTQPTGDFSDSVTLPLSIAPLGIDSALMLFHPATPGMKSAAFEISDTNAGKNDGIQHVRDVVLTGKSLPSIVATVSVDTTYSARVGDQITIPVTLQTDISAANATYFKINLLFDGGILLPLSLQAGSIANGYSIAMNEASPGNIAVQGTGAQPIAGTGNMFAITYQVLSSGATETPIVVQSPFIGDGVLPRKTLGVNGKFTVAGQCGSSVYLPSQATQLSQNIPNPFSNQTAINYKVALPEHVTIAIYDALGRQIAVPVDKDQNIGEYSVPFNASDLKDGIYYCRMTAGQYVMTKAMMLMK